MVSTRAQNESKNETFGLNMKKILLLAALAVPAVAQTAKVDHTKQDVACLKANLFFEARGESLKGKEAVAKVTLNRVKSKKYPSSVCAVVFQKKQFSWSFQQPYSKIQKVLQGDMRGYSALDKQAYLESKKTAETALKTPPNVLPESALWYHANYVQPKWAAKMKKVKQVGKHIFYVPKAPKK